MICHVAGRDPGLALVHAAGRPRPTPRRGCARSSIPRRRGYASLRRDLRRRRSAALAHRFGPQSIARPRGVRPVTRRCGGRTRDGRPPPADVVERGLAASETICSARSSRARARRRSPAPRRASRCTSSAARARGPCVSLARNSAQSSGVAVSTGSASETNTSTTSPVDVVIGPPRNVDAQRAASRLGAKRSLGLARRARARAPAPCRAPARCRRSRPAATRAHDEQRPREEDGEARGVEDARHPTLIAGARVNAG